MDEAQIRSLADAGTGIGCHRHSHTVPRLLASIAEQGAEVSLCLQFLSGIIGSGTPVALSDNAKEAVKMAGFRFAFGVNSLDIQLLVSASPRFELPRHNCNAFPYRRVSMLG